MTVFLVTVIKRFIGETIDVKPTTGVPPGSTFFETDTKNTLIYTGSAWSHTVGNPVYGIHASQGISISEEETEYETAYIVSTPSQSMRLSEAVAARLQLFVSAPVDGTLITDTAGGRLYDNVVSTQVMAIVEAGAVEVTL